MSLVNLKSSILQELQALVDNPTAAPPTALKLLGADGQWDLLTQKISSDMVKASQSELTLPLLEKSATEEGAISSA